MNTKIIYPEGVWMPYCYKLTLTKGSEEFYYIGSRSAKSVTNAVANPNELFAEEYNSSSTDIHQMLKSGWECKREILFTFEGTEEGAIACCVKEGQLLTEVDAMHNSSYINRTNIGATYVTEEVKQKMSLSHTGKKFTEEHKSRIGQSKVGKKRKPFSQEWCKKIGEARKGNKHSEETKQKMSDAWNHRPPNPSGKDHAGWKPFKLISETVEGEIKEYLFDGDTPSRTCTLEFGVDPGMLGKLKKGESFIIKQVKDTTRHPFAKGTKVTLQYLGK